MDSVVTASPPGDQTLDLLNCLWGAKDPHNPCAECGLYRVKVNSPRHWAQGETGGVNKLRSYGDRAAGRACKMVRLPSFMEEQGGGRLLPSLGNYVLS